MVDYINSHGGRRSNAGRPFASEQTSPVRIPNSLKPIILQLVQDYKKAMRLPPGTLRPDTNAPVVLLPLFAEKVPAGFPSPATDYVEDRLDLNQLLIQHPEATFFVQVKGNSMIGAGIHDGDKLVVDRSINPTHGHVVIAVVDGDFTVKRLHRQDGFVKLIAENPEYPDITFKVGQELQIFGVVTSVIHKL